MPSGRIKGITIEIGGDTTKLTDSLKDVDKELDSTNKQLKDVNKLLKFDPQNAVLLEQKQRLLGESIQKTKERLDKLKEAQAKAKELLEKGELGQDKYDALCREVEDTQISLNNLEKQAEKTADSSDDMGKAAKDAGGDMSSMGTESLTAMEALDKVGGVLESISGKLIQLGQDAVAAWGEFDDSLDTIQYATGRSNESMAALEETLFEINRNIPVSDINDLGAAIGDMATRTNLTDEEINDFATDVAKLSKMSGESASSITSDAIAIAETYNISYGEALDIMHRAGQSFGLTFDQMGQAATGAGLVLHDQLGMSIEDITGLMGLMNAQGLDANSAIGAMTKAAMNMSKDGKLSIENFNAVLTSLKDGTMSTSDATEIFGAKAGQFINFLQDSGISSVEDLTAAYDDMCSQGMSVNEMYDEMYDEGDAAAVAQQNLNEMMGRLGETIMTALAPAIEGLTNLIQGMVNWWTSLDSSTQTLIVTIGAMIVVVTTIIGVITTVGSVMTALTAISTALNIGMLPLIGTIGLIVGAIAAVIAIGVLLYQNWDTIKQKAVELYERLREKFEQIRSTISDKVEAAKKKVTDVFSSIKKAITDKINDAKQAVSDAIEKIKGFFNFSWSLPKLKMPHINITGEFSLVPPKTPSFSIDWYAKAMNTPMLLNGATIFGAMNGKLLGGGETGQEVIMGKDLYDRMTGPSLTVNAYFNGGYNRRDGAALAKQINRELGGIYR